MAKDLSKPKTFALGFQARKKSLIICTMALPGVIWLLLLRYLPMFGIVLAFKDYRIYPKSPTFLNNMIHSAWVGLDNFKFLFATTDSWVMIRNTIGYNGLFIVLTLAIAVSLAIMLNELTTKFVAKTYQTMMFFPYFLSWVVVSYFLLAFLNTEKGLIVHMQQNMGVTPINWYNEAKYWPFIIAIANMWKNVGYSCILYLAAIAGIDTTQYEAAHIDGANKWQQIIYVTLPHLKSIIIILFIMNVGRILNADFGLFYSVPMNSGPLFPTTQVIDTYVYRALISSGDVGMSSAAGLFQNAVGFVLIMITNSIVKKVDPDSSLF